MGWIFLDESSCGTNDFESSVSLAAIVVRIQNNHEFCMTLRSTKMSASDIVDLKTGKFHHSKVL